MEKIETNSKVVNTEVLKMQSPWTWLLSSGILIMKIVTEPMLQLPIVIGEERIIINVI